MFDADEIKTAVRERYAGHVVAAGRGPATPPDAACCGSAPVATAVPSAHAMGPASTAGCCGSAAPASGSESVALGYDPADLAEIPDGADLALGCGNPLALLDLREGETVLDLGSGGGIDCFLAAKRVGPTGHVIGVDMTAEMIDRARHNAAAGDYPNVEFRLGEIEHLPVADGTVDAIISNCVINLAPDKHQVFSEAFRVLAPGGRLSVSDIVLLGDVPIGIRDSVDAYVACLSGAILRDAYLGMLRDAGFAEVEVTSERAFGLEDVVAADLVAQFAENTGATDSELRAAAAMFQSVRVQARKAG